MIDWFLLLLLSKSLQQVLPAARKLSVIKRLTEFLLCGCRGCQSWSVPPATSACVDDLACLLAELARVWFILECCMVPGCCFGILRGLNDCGSVGRAGFPITQDLAVEIPLPPSPSLCPRAGHLTLNFFGGTICDVQTGGAVFFATTDKCLVLMKEYQQELKGTSWMCSGWSG